MKQIIYLIRHGETVFNTEGRYQGELDSPLTRDGIEQVTNVSRLLKVYIEDPHEWDIVTSPLGRAIKSTEIVCDILGFERQKVRIDDRLSEVSVGDWAGLTTSEIERSWSELLQHTNSYNWYFNSPNGESYQAVVERVSDWLESIKNQPRVIAVSHGLTGRILRGVYVNLKKEQALKLEVSQNTFFKLSNQTIERFCCEYDEF